MELEFSSDSSLMVRFAGQSSIETSLQVLGLFQKLLNSGLPIMDLHPAYCSLQIDFDPGACDPLELKRKVQEIPASNAALPGELISIPVVYDGADFAEIARATGLAREEIIQIHTAPEYLVAFLGFTPGFPYLLGLDKRLAVPRKTSPRVRVPAGSVAIAGEQAGIYPMESPGGWQLLGHTALPLKLKPGNRVRFTAAQTLPEFQTAPLAGLPTGLPVLQILEAGIHSSLERRARTGHAHLGISAGGPADPESFELANRLTGNRAGSAALELTISGGAYRFLRDTWFAVTGDVTDLFLDGIPVLTWNSLPASAGQVLKIGKLSRGYLSVHGGFTSKLGGLLYSGQEIERAPAFRRCLPENSKPVLRVTQGPQWASFDTGAQQIFLADEFKITPEADRRGIRLEGPSLAREVQELVSEGVANGAIQVSGGGQAMILFCEQQTTGGYPKIANVIRADIAALGRLQPNDRVRFEQVSLEDAWRLNGENSRRLQKVIEEY